MTFDAAPFVATPSVRPARLDARSRRLAAWALAGWLIIGVLGSGLLLRSAIDQARDAFETEARIAHRLLSQRAVQHEAMLITLSQLPADAVPAVVQRLTAVYPQLLTVRQVVASTAADPVLPQLLSVDWAAGSFAIVASSQAGAQHAYALELSLAQMVPWSEWPFGAAPQAGTAAVVLALGADHWVVHPPQAEPALLSFEFHKHLAAASQPFDMVAVRAFRWADVPWGALGLGWAVWAILAAAALAYWRQHDSRRRAEALLRLGQVSRLNALGELAAGMAHELNQPLTAVLAGTQASRRLLKEPEPDLDAARDAMQHVAGQARRAADVVARLRRCIDRPGVRDLGPVDPAAVVAEVMQLLAPECARRGVAVSLPAPGPKVLADAVALEQVVHNLASNALHAFEGCASPALSWRLERLSQQRIALQLRDNGPGLPAEVAQRLFEPFVSARPGGLGLGLSLCDTLVAEMNGVLRHQTPDDGVGAIFIVELPSAQGHAL